MSEAGTEVSFSSRKRIAFALGSGSGCAKGEIADLIAAVIEIPLYYPALARTDLPALCRNGIRWTASKSLLHPGVTLNLTAVRVRRAEMLWCGCPQRTLPNVTPVRSTSDGAPLVETAFPTEPVRDRRLTGLPLMIPASLARARASCAFTVPSGTPKTC